MVDMMKQAQRIEHAEFSLKRGTPMWEKFKENSMYYNEKVLLVKCFKKIHFLKKENLKKAL